VVVHQVCEIARTAAREAGRDPGYGDPVTKARTAPASAVFALLVGCTRDGDTDTGPTVPGAWRVEVAYDPDPPVAGSPTEITASVLDPYGNPAESLQQSHERMLHTVIIPRDLETFGHVHHEDFTELTADDLRNATYHYPYTFPAAGPYVLVFDYASENVYRQSRTEADVSGSPAQLGAPVIDGLTERDIGDLHVVLGWDTAPVAGTEAAWTITVTEGGEDVVDVVQWLGADAHAVVHDVALDDVGHTHAWVPGMENLPPGHEMPHVYDGPEIPFHYTFPASGSHKMWVQFARAAAPEEPITVPFTFEVAP
jgi:hypothetical protein